MLGGERKLKFWLFRSILKNPNQTQKTKCKLNIGNMKNNPLADSAEFV